jgi:hypothetical protein
MRLLLPEGVEFSAREEVVASEEEPRSRATFPRRLSVAAPAFLLVITGAVLGIGAAIYSSEEAAGVGGFVWSEFALAKAKSISDLSQGGAGSLEAAMACS